MSLIDAVKNVQERLKLGQDIRSRLVEELGEKDGNKEAEKALRYASEFTRRLELFKTEEAKGKGEKFRFKMKPETIWSWLDKMAPDEFTLRVEVYVLHEK